MFELSEEQTLPDSGLSSLGKTPLSSQDGLHQRHHVVNAARYIHHLTWNGHLRITEERLNRSRLDLGEKNKTSAEKGGSLWNGSSR